MTNLLSSTPRKLAALAGTLAVLAFVVDRPGRGTPGLDEVATQAQREQDHISAIELGEWIRDGKTGLRVIDLRDAALFEEYHLPTAENIAIGEIARLTTGPDDTIVLYDSDVSHTAHALILLRAKGLRNGFILHGGVDEWLDLVMSPHPPAAPTREQQHAWERQIAVSEYFGGVPNLDEPAPATAQPKTADRVKRIKRRGC